MTDRRIYRYEVPVDDQWHSIHDCGEPLSTAARWSETTVEFWAWNTPTEQPRLFRVFGTGHTIPEGTVHRGLVFVRDGLLVWHLIEKV